MLRSRPTLFWSLLAVAVFAAVAGAALLALRPFGSSTATTGTTLPHDAPPAAIDARVLCSLSNDDALASLVTGADGGTSVMVGGRTWWLFGDTIFRGDSGKQIEPNSIAVSSERRPDGCPRLEYHSENGIAVPFIEKDGSLTVWPTGGFADGDANLSFYTAYVYGSGPYSYSVDEVGAARLDTDTMETEVLNRTLWDETSGFPSRVILAQPVEVSDDSDDLLRVVLHAQDTSKYLARVEPGQFADATAYEFWNGVGWSESAADVSALWSLPEVVDPVEQLLHFENGASIAWNPALSKYVALVNAGFDGIGARVADKLEGPWSEPVRWLDCLAFANARVPTCYSPQQHASYAGDDGRRIYVTISAIEPYETQFVEITPGTPVHEYELDGDIRYSTVPLAGWQDQGVAFYAADARHEGFVAIYAWERGEEVRYAATSPGEGFEQKEPAFYAPTTADSSDGLIHYRPVYDWANGASHILSPLETGLEEYGYKRGSAMFYAP